MPQHETPLLTAMQRYVAAGVTPFYTPGHKMGKGMEPVLADILGSTALALDMGLPHEMDDLYEPQGPIKAAQQLAAALYGADHSFFVINGTTAALQAMILAVAGPGEKILVPRNAHRSIIGGIILSGAIPVFLAPEIDPELGLAMGVPPATVQQALSRHSDAKGLLLINPTYYGVATDLRAIVELAHRQALPVLVDEAHGPHLNFSDRLPLAALDAGADATAQSTHKIIGALTQASMLHCQEGRISPSRLRTMLQLVQSTSPNYLLLASLDVARMQMATRGRELTEQAIALAEQVRCAVNAIPGLYCFGLEKTGAPGVHSLDPTKVTVTVSGLGITGRQAEDILRQRYRVQAELSDMHNVLFLITLGDCQADVQRLVTALQDLAASYRGRRNGRRPPAVCAEALPFPEQVLSPREAVFAKSGNVAFASAAGRVCAEIITFYPPGIPVLCPGERITRDLIGHCQRLQAAGLHISGPEDHTLQTVKVVE